MIAIPVYIDNRASAWTVVRLAEVWIDPLYIMQESLLPTPATKAEDFLDLDYLESMFAYRTITQVACISPTLLPIRFDSFTMHLARFWDG